MEMLIYNHMLFDSLMPWLVSTADVQQMRDSLKQLSAPEPDTMQELHNTLSKLLVYKPTLLNWLAKQKTKQDDLLKPLSYSTILPNHADIQTKFYKTLIDYETIRIYTSYFRLSDKYQADEDLLIYHTENALRNLKHYIRIASKKIKENNFEFKYGINLELTPFVLYYLKYKLIALYFSIQIINKDLLSVVWDLQDFYLLELEETTADFHDIKYIPPAAKTPSAQKVIKTNLSFGFKGDASNLTNLIKVLCSQINLLDEDVTAREALIEVLTADDLSQYSSKIKFGCNTNLLTYVVDSLRPKFPKLTYTNIEKAGLFYSESGVPIRQSLFSNSKSNNPLAQDKKEEIDKIFRENHM